jgi:hypothetical protein
MGGAAGLVCESKRERARYGCHRPERGRKRCPQCWKVLPWPAAFLGTHPDPRVNCRACLDSAKASRVAARSGP